ncbi:MAG: hypothetical protein J6X57_04365 [Bacteroidales bacterium]|nr:hypothetical protein [Bacteroidales bacterium]
MTILAAFVLVSGAAYAQGSLLRGIGEKAKQAAGQQLKKNIGGALGLGGGDNTQSQSNTETYSSVSMTYAQELLDPDQQNDFYPTEEKASTYKFATYQDAINARLALPKQGSLNSIKDYEAYAAKVADMREATLEMIRQYSLRQSELNNQSMNGPSSYTSQGAGQINMTPDEVFKAISDAGLNPTTATETQIQDAVAAYVAKKQGISKEQAVKLMAESAAAQKDQPKSRIQEIQDELSAIFESRAMSAVNAAQTAITSLSTALLGGKTAVDETNLSGALFALRKKIIAAWPKSEECKTVNQLERSQGVKSRDKQDEIIDKWNSKQLDQWIAKITQFENAEAETAKKVAALDAELEGMSATDKKTSEWASAKTSVITLNGIILSYMEMPAQVFDCPLVSHAPKALED